MNKNCVEKNKEYMVSIIDNGFEGEGIAKIDNFTIFIPGAIKGEEVKILIVKVLSSYAYGKIINITKKAKERIKVDCNSYKRCGGCSLRHIDYTNTLKIKQNSVQSLVNKSLNKKIEVKDTIGMENPYHYRNKAQYPVGLNKENEPIYGVFAKRSHEIIETQNCFIQNEITQNIANSVINFFKNENIPVYNEKTGKGLLRHIVIKIGVNTKEIMCVLVINGNKIQNEKKLVKQLITEYPNIKTIVKNINKKNTNVILGNENINIYGDGYIYDKLGEFLFKISPLSFYQVNPIQAEKLYNIGVEQAKITKDDIVVDLYCGVGTISLFMSKFAKKVYGVEIVKDAVKDAIENAKLNNINNVDFISGDTEIVFDDLIKNRGIIPDVLMIDPPRRGLDNKTIENILNIKPNRIVYISCNPATLIRDLKNFEKTYDIIEIQPVDMFPYTSHVECVTVLYLK